jgi:hypothetical protein
MRNLIIYLAVMLCTFATKIYAQEAKETFESKAKDIALRIEKINKEEKKALKEKIELVNQELNKSLITSKQADEKKIQLATISAKQIETRLAEEESKLSQLIQDKAEGKMVQVDTTKHKDESFVFSIKTHKKNKNDTIKSEKRTTSQVVIAVGFNNLITNGNISNSDFGYLRSGFLEWGFTHNTRILKDNNLLHFKYGVSFMYNTLYPTNNRSFQVNGDQITLVTNQFYLRKSDSYFKNVFVTIPLHLEFDFSKNKTFDDKIIFRSHKGFRIGLGGFVGYNINSKQFLSYDLDNYRVDVKQKGNWNIEDWNYGFSAYMGHGETSLYLKYDLNPMFKNNAIKQNNVSLGIRWDFN